jgi:hypothetical protein
MDMTFDNAADLTLEGFGSAYYGQVYGSNVLPYGFSGKSANFTEFSLIGLNIRSKINDQFSVAAQIVGTGASEGANTNYTLFADWAYVNYTPVDELNIRAGRQRYPIFTASEYINEHEELPFRVMPSIIYGLAPLDSFDGVSISKTIDAGSGKFQFSAFGGSPVINGSSSTTSYVATGVPVAASFHSSNLVGAKITYEGDGFRLRAQASRSTETATSTVELAAPYGSSSYYEAHEENFTVGYRYDKHNIVSWGEYLFAVSPGSTTVPAGNGLPGGAFLGKAQGGYILVGYRVGDFLPRYTFAQASV